MEKYRINLNNQMDAWAGLFKKQLRLNSRIWPLQDKLLIVVMMPLYLGKLNNLWVAI